MARSSGDSHFTVDAEIITEGTWYLQVMSTLIPQVSLSIYFLYRQLQWAALVGFGWIILVLGGTQGLNSKAMASAYESRMKVVPDLP